VQVGIGSEKSILNRIFRVSRIAQDAVGSSVQRQQATSQNLFELPSCSLFTWNFIAFVIPAVRICLLHAVFLQFRESPRDQRIDSFLFPNLKLSVNHSLVSADSSLRGELVLSQRAL
jgi:hypothetical protein